MKLNSFGLGVFDPKNLTPGECFVFTTNKKMSSIVDGNHEHPLELGLSQDDFDNRLVFETFPVQTSSLMPDASENLKKKKKKKSKQKRGSPEVETPMASSSHTSKFSSHEITASNNFRTKLSQSSDSFTEMPTEAEFVVDEKGDTILVPPTFDSPDHAFHEHVLTWCKTPKSV